MSRWIHRHSLLSIRWGIRGESDAIKIYYNNIGVNLPAYRLVVFDGRVIVNDLEDKELLIWERDLAEELQREALGFRTSTWTIPDKSMIIIDKNELSNIAEYEYKNIMRELYFKIEDVEVFENKFGVSELLKREYGITPPPKIDFEQERIEDISRSEPGQLAAGKDKTTRERWRDYLQTAVMLAARCVELGGSYTKPELDEIARNLGRETLTEEAMQAFRSAMPDKYIHSGGRKKKPQEN